MHEAQCDAKCSYRSFAWQKRGHTQNRRQCLYRCQLVRHRRHYRRGQCVDCAKHAGKRRRAGQLDSHRLARPHHHRPQVPAPQILPPRLPRQQNYLSTSPPTTNPHKQLHPSSLFIFDLVINPNIRSSLRLSIYLTVGNGLN